MKLFCSRDSITVSDEVWEAHALLHICASGDYEGWCDPTRWGNNTIPMATTAAAYQESGIGSAAKALLPKALRVGRNTRPNYSVYLGIRDGKPIYAGITNNFARRAGEHAGRFDELVQVTSSTVTRGEARAIEQALIGRNPQFANRINSISPAHSYQQRAVDWGEAWLRANGF